MLNKAAYFRFHDNKMAIPLYWLSPCDVTSVFIRRITRFAEICNRHLGSFDFIDCGANLGTFAAQFTRFAANVRKLTAIEANPELIPLMKINLSNAASATELIPLHGAISDGEGFCRMVAPTGKWDKDSFYILDDPNGDIPIITLSSILRSRSCNKVAIKLDIEGAEVPAINGGADQIRALDRVVLFIEFHRDVLSRTGTTDQQMIAEIEKIRRFDWIDSATGKTIDRSRSVFEQTDPQQCDLIAIN